MQLRSPHRLRFADECDRFSSGKPRNRRSCCKRWFNPDQCSPIDESCRGCRRSINVLQRSDLERRSAGIDPTLGVCNRCIRTSPQPAYDLAHNRISNPSDSRLHRLRSSKVQEPRIGSSEQQMVGASNIERLCGTSLCRFRRAPSRCGSPRIDSATSGFHQRPDICAG